MDVIEEMGDDCARRCYWDFGRWSDLWRVWRPAGNDRQPEEAVDFEVRLLYLLTNCTSSSTTSSCDCHFALLTYNHLHQSLVTEHLLLAVRQICFILRNLLHQPIMSSNIEVTLRSVWITLSNLLHQPVVLKFHSISLRPSVVLPYILVLELHSLCTIH